ILTEVGFEYPSATSRGSRRCDRTGDRGRFYGTASTARGTPGLPRGHSSAARSQPAASAAATYVVCKNSRSAPSGSALVRIASYGNRNSPASREKNASAGPTVAASKPGGAG